MSLWKLLLLVKVFENMTKIKCMTLFQQTVKEIRRFYSKSLILEPLICLKVFLIAYKEKKYSIVIILTNNFDFESLSFDP